MYGRLFSPKTYRNGYLGDLFGINWKILVTLFPKSEQGKILLFITGKGAETTEGDVAHWRTVCALQNSN